MPQRKPEDGIIDWHSMSALKLYNWIRAQSHPYPGAFTYLGNNKVTIWKSSLTNINRPINSHSPGEIDIGILNSNDKLGVWCADGYLLQIHEVEVNSSGIIPITDFIKDYIKKETLNKILRFL
jgi:methionyl-tRNA formyltransferase